MGELVKNWGKRRRGEEELLEIYMYSSYLGKYSKFEGTFFRPRFFDLRIVRYSKLLGTGSKSYDAVFNYRVNNELNFPGQLHSFEKYLSVKGTRICYIFPPI